MVRWRFTATAMNVPGVPGVRRADARRDEAYFRASEDWSTVTPGPMVELIEIFCR